MGVSVIFDLLPMLLIEFHRPAGFPILGVNLFRPTVIPDRLPLPNDLLHAVLLLPDGSFQFVLMIRQSLNLIIQLFQRTDVMLFQKDDHLRFCVDVIPLSPDLITFPLAGAELCFYINQSLDLTFGEITTRDFWNVHMIMRQRPAQGCLIVFRSKGIEPDISLSLRRLDADLRAALYATSGIFQHLHQRIEAIRLHPQRGVDDHSQLVPMGETPLIALPFVVGNGFVLRILNDRQTVFPAKRIADLRKILC